MNVCVKIMNEKASHMDYMKQYKPAPNKLIMITTMKNIVIQTALLTDLFQKFIRIEDALSSVGKSMALGGDWRNRFSLGKRRRTMRKVRTNYTSSSSL